MTQTEKVVHSLLTLMAEKNLEEIAQLFAETVDWNIPGNNERAGWVGRRGSRKEVREFFTLLWSNTEMLNARAEKIMVDGGDAIIAGRFSTKMLKTGGIVDSLFLYIWSWRTNSSPGIPCWKTPLRSFWHWHLLIKTS